MPSYNEIDGIPSHSNRHLLQDVLRQEWGFTGLVASDYFGPTELRTIHHIVGDDAAAAKIALESGVDIELPFPGTYPSLLQQVQQGMVAEASIDLAVTRVLRTKFLAGLFDDPYVDAAYAEKSPTMQNTGSWL
jgi:beta-glucosidase